MFIRPQIAAKPIAPRRSPRELSVIRPSRRTMTSCSLTRSWGFRSTAPCCGKRFKRAVKAAKVRDVRFHDLRHTFATRMAATGVPMRNAPSVARSSRLRDDPPLRRLHARSKRASWSRGHSPVTSTVTSKCRQTGQLRPTQTPLPRTKPPESVPDRDLWSRRSLVRIRSLTP